ncbi:hypothetical protein MPTK1_8g01750 [Marchantia polymorpha subsp. ruderalis]|uniref:Uncharacterized protein n=1 Tax=Marchantia polymorpha TaxID=3197 RepID=A0A2R6WR69_MARPO|nr:hypothetical protein MARPO_0064s0025 [Marchantia polymorpha]BBN18337.1 hypothetical protein Mp_8g01750 [Marchantia polymorpha subsp. ruderalis]|eukprot:PTQ36336.1 hypothetical protein MARPO_0064s0025 [Marchantia polymorpha]
MTNPCYDFALRSHSNIPNSYVQRRHEPRRAPSPASPSSQESDFFDDDHNHQNHNHNHRNRGDRGRWKTDGTVSIAEGYEDSILQRQSSPSSACQCPNCACHRESAYQDPDASAPRRPRSSRGLSSSGGSDQHDSRKHPPPVPKVDHSLWNPLQLLRRPHTSSTRERERGRDREWSRPNSSACALGPLRPRSEVSRSRDVCPRRGESHPSSSSRSPPRSSKVRSLRRTQQQRRLSPRKSPSRCSTGSKIPSASTRRYHHTDTLAPPPWRDPSWTEKLDIACQTRREEFPLTPEETPRASPVRRVISSDSSFYHDRAPIAARPFSCPAAAAAAQRRPSPCRCLTATAAAAAAPRGCCCNHCVGWQERATCPKAVVAAPPLHHACAACHHGFCSRAAEPIRNGECCPKCHQPVPATKAREMD